MDAPGNTMQDEYVLKQKIQWAGVVELRVWLLLIMQHPLLALWVFNVHPATVAPRHATLHDAES